MRPKKLNFEQLVKQNKQELLNDENTIQQIEQRLENKHKEQLSNKYKNREKVNI